MMSTCLPRKLYCRGYFSLEAVDPLLLTSTSSHSPVSGTSASSPAAAGLFNLINDLLLNSRKPTLGFLNPLLYQMAEEHPIAFNDITSGDNKNDGLLFCKYGFEATPGWDPASGLGSPNFPEIVRYVKRINNIN